MASRVIKLYCRVSTVAAKLVGESLVPGLERIVRARVDPDGLAYERRRVRGRRADDVVAHVILGVVEGAGSRVVTGLPQRRAVPADGAEAARMVQREIQGSEAAHGEPAD